MPETGHHLKFWKWLLNMRIHARFGVAASVIGLFGIGVAQGSGFIAHREIVVWCLAGVLVATGVLLLRQPEAEVEEVESDVPNSVFVPQQPGDIAPPECATSVFTRRYWGWVALGCGVMVVVAAGQLPAPAPFQAAPRLVAKELPPPPQATNPPVIVPPPAPVELPALKLQGIHLLPSHPAAKIWLRNHMTRADVDLLAKSGSHSIRLPMHYNLFTLPIEEEPVQGGATWLTAGFTLTDHLLACCKANRLYRILDLHAAPGGQGKDANFSDYDSSKPSRGRVRRIGKRPSRSGESWPSDWPPIVGAIHREAPSGVPQV